MKLKGKTGEKAELNYLRNWRALITRNCKITFNIVKAKVGNELPAVRSSGKLVSVCASVPLKEARLKGTNKKDSTIHLEQPTSQNRWMRIKTKVWHWMTAIASSKRAPKCRRPLWKTQQSFSNPANLSEMITQQNP